jgi:hypothetical protein
MRSKTLWALGALNVVLVVALIGRVALDNPANAQQRVASARPSDYLMIPGDVSGVPAGVVYMIDTTNGLLSAVTYDDSNKRVSMMQPIELSRIFEQASRRR